MLNISSADSVSIAQVGNTPGYDGHCLRAFAYFAEQMPDIDPNSVASINSIKVKYAGLRQDSKAPTFALTYQGTAYTLMKNLGWSKDKAEAVETAFKGLYQESIDWVQNKLQQANKDGYVTLAFGLRLRTPMIKKVRWNTSSVPKEAIAEGRTAGNALGQGYGLLNNRAGIELQEKTLASPYRTLILPCAHIHDAQYFLCVEDLGAVEWLNRELPKAMEWQELPEIQHPEVKLGGSLDIFYPDWSAAVTLPRGAPASVIADHCAEHARKLEEKQAA